MQMKSSVETLAALIVGLLSALAFTGSSAAASRPVDCEITVMGKTYVKKVCQFTPDGASFQIDAGEYFAQVKVQGATAELNWNEIPGATHAQSYLGSAHREGPCWVSSKARICARALPAAQTRAMVAAAPSGGNLQLVAAGYPCLGVEKHTLGLQTSVVLQECRFPADNIWAKGKDGGLEISKRPDLCLMAESPGMNNPPQVIVDTCRPDLPRWTVGTGPEGAPVIASDGWCLTIPLIAKPDTKFPWPASAAPCAKVSGKAPKFIYEIPK